MSDPAADQSCGGTYGIPFLNMLPLKLISPFTVRPVLSTNKISARLLSFIPPPTMNKLLVF